MQNGEDYLVMICSELDNFWRENSHATPSKLCIASNRIFPKLKETLIAKRSKYRDMYSLKS